MPEINCPTCEGSGEYPPGTSCTTCGGDGIIEATGTHRITQAYVKAVDGKIDTIALPSNVFQSYKVLECLDATEHAALTDTQKDGVKTLLSCGCVDLNDGKAGKVRLWNWFGAESTTVANLTALLT